MLELEGLAAIAVRVSVMYLYALAMLRLSGKRSIAQLAGPDVAATIIVGDMFDDIFWSEISLAKGLTGMTTVVVLHVLSKVFEWRSRLVKRVLDGEPVLAVLNGSYVKSGLDRERIPESGLRELLRIKGVDDLSIVREARLEVDGNLSVLRLEERKAAQKRQQEALREVVK